MSSRLACFEARAVQKKKNDGRLPTKWEFQARLSLCIAHLENNPQFCVEDDASCVRMPGILHWLTQFVSVNLRSVTRPLTASQSQGPASPSSREFRRGPWPWPSLSKSSFQPLLLGSSVLAFKGVHAILGHTCCRFYPAGTRDGLSTHCHVAVDQHPGSGLHPFDQTRKNRRMHPPSDLYGNY